MAAPNVESMIRKRTKAPPAGEARANNSPQPLKSRENGDQIALVPDATIRATAGLPWGRIIKGEPPDDDVTHDRPARRNFSAGG